MCIRCMRTSPSFKAPQIPLLIHHSTRAPLSARIFSEIRHITPSSPVLRICCAAHNLVVFPSTDRRMNVSSPLLSSTPQPKTLTLPHPTFSLPTSRIHIQMPQTSNFHSTPHNLSYLECRSCRRERPYFNKHARISKPHQTKLTKPNPTQLTTLNFPSTNFRA
jgi:hypothetical protein